MEKEGLIPLTRENIDALLDALRPIVMLHVEQDKPFESYSDEDLSGELSGYCPVQGNGQINNLPWYFRARHDEWSFSIAEDRDANPLDVRWGNQSGWYYENEYLNASWMTYEDAWKIIRDCIEKYRKNEGYTVPKQG